MNLIPTKIVVHCSDTEDGQNLSWPAIKKYHMEHNGWADIGYHFGVEMHGGDLIALPGRPAYQKGAHCRAAGRNNDSLGVCFVGRFDTIPPSVFLLEAACSFISWLCLVFAIPANQVYGHREFEQGKSCPGERWPLEEMRRLIARNVESAVGRRIVLASGLKGGSSVPHG